MKLYMESEQDNVGYFINFCITYDTKFQIDHQGLYLFHDNIFEGKIIGVDEI